MKRRIGSGFLGLLLVILIFALVACNNNDEIITETRGITVNKLDVVTLETFPVQVQATVGGTLNDNCTTITNITAPRQERTFTIDIQFAFADNGACTADSIDFSQVVALDVLNLPAGDYSVIAGEVNSSFNLPVDNVQQADSQPQPTGPTLTTAATNVLAGQSLGLTGQGFPVNAQVEISMGLVNGDRNTMSIIPAGADGTFSTQVVIPSNSNPNEQLVFGATANGTTTLSSPVTVVTEVAPENEQAQNSGGVNVASNGLFSKTYIYMISLNDGGPVGCSDSVVPVEIDIEPTAAVMTAAYTRLFTIKDQNYGGHYNALYQSNLTLAGINIVNRQAIVSLTGTLTLGGECDNPRVIEQLKRVALQYSTVDSVQIWLNGELLEPVGLG